MSCGEIGSDYKAKEKLLLLNTVEMLNEERQTILFEVLKCDICLELPQGKQVLICEKGHHFCFTCYQKINKCGICRGKLLYVRNFVVEQLVTKLGPILGLTKSVSPVQSPAKPIPGSFKCLHNCTVKVSSLKLLSHLRMKHSDNFMENVVCNPYSNRFSLKYNITFDSNGSFIYSAFVSDLGLCTVEIVFLDFNFFGCARILVNDSDLPHFRYQMMVKVPTSQMILEYGITDCAVSHFTEDRQSILQQGNFLKIKSNTFLEHINKGSKIDVFFSIWKKSDMIEVEKTLNFSINGLSEKLLPMTFDRKARRNKNRNARRKKKKTLINQQIKSNQQIIHISFVGPRW